MLSSELHEFINEHIVQLVEMENEFLDHPTGVSQSDFIRFCCLLHIDDQELLTKIIRETSSYQRLRIRKTAEVIFHEYFHSGNVLGCSDSAEWIRRTRTLLEKVETDVRWGECERLEIRLSIATESIFSLEKFIENTVHSEEISPHTISVFKSIAFEDDRHAENVAATRTNEERKQLYKLASTVSQKAYINMLSSKYPKAWGELVDSAERVMRFLHEARFHPIIPFGMVIPADKPAVETKNEGDDNMACFVFDLIDRSIDMSKTVDPDIPSCFEPEYYHRFTALMGVKDPVNIEKTLRSCSKTKLEALHGTGVKFLELLENRKSEEDLADIKHIRTILGIMDFIKGSEEDSEQTSKPTKSEE